MEKILVSRGVYLVQIPEAGLSVLCGCPPDVTKHLMKRGLISPRTWDRGLWETGPNAILLSDLPVQGGKFANLAEFPILQMFYRQGLIVPGHPGNTGRKPLVLGLSHQLVALSDYLFRGTYGLADSKEIIASGIEPAMAEEIVRIKLAFAFNKIRKSEDLLDMRPLESEALELDGGLRVERLATNVFRFSLGKDFLDVDLNMPEGSVYESPVHLDFHRIRREYFSIIHIGEGDGWDPHRPCMSSIVVFQGKIYLIDTGPNILDSLTALGISVNEVEGIFHTHAHDDHFAGLTSLIRTDHRIKHFATPLVRSSIMKKLAAIASLPERRFMRSFEIRDLKQEVWNDIEGLEVMPNFSIHPVETTVLHFRALWEGGYKTYSHLADIASEEVMKEILVDAENSTEISQELYRDIRHTLLKPADVKKIDIGGGMIHGAARDFVRDRSRKIVLAHLSRDLTPEEKEIGSNASFGQEDILIPTQRDFIREAAEKYLESYFPKARTYELGMLVNCPIRRFNPGYIILKKNSPSPFVYLIITGVAELVHADLGLEHMLSAGTLIGELNALGGTSGNFTYRAKSYVNVLEIPAELFRPFIQRNADLEQVKQIGTDMLFLQETRLFGEMVSSPVLYRIAASMTRRQVPKGSELNKYTEDALAVLEVGRVELKIEGKLVDLIEPGEFFGEESVLIGRGENAVNAKATEDSRFLCIPANVLRDVPIVEWKLLEYYERRLRSFGESLKREIMEENGA